MDSGTGTKTTHILLLEDDRAHQDFILRAFRDDPEQFRLSVAGNIREARRVLEQDPPDLIVADWILPDGKGLDILPRRDGRVTIPLVIMTSFGDEHLAVEIMKSGAIDYVVKSAMVFRDMPHIARRALREWEHIQERIRAEGAEQESRKRLADIIGFLPDAMLAIDNDGRVIAWNDAIERMTGVVAKDMIGKGDHEYSIPFYGERRPILIDLVLMRDDEVEKKYDYFQRDGKTITSETFIQTLYGGEGAYLWGTASPLFDNAGNRIGAIEVIRDITDRKQVEKELQAKEHQLSTIYRNTPEILFFLEVEHNNRYRFLSVNQPFLDVTGLTQEQVVGKYVHEVIPEPSLTLVLEKYNQAISDNTTVIWEEITEYPSGTKYGEVSITPLIDATGRCTNLIGSVHDITGRKLADEKIRESEKKYRFLIDNVRDIVWQTTPDLTFTYLSPAAETLTGYPQGELIGTSLFGLLTEPSARIVREMLRERMVEYSPGSRDIATVIETEITQKSGGTRWLEVSANAVFGASGSLEGFQGISRDITDRKKAEKALVESEMRFHDLFHNMSAGVVIYEPTPDGEDFIIRDVNWAAETIEKVKKDEIIGRSVLEVFPGVKEFGIFEVFQRVARTGVAEAFPVSMYHDNRIAGWRENYVYKLPSGEVVAIYEDVTERKRVEEELQVKEYQLSTIYRNISEVLFFLSVEQNDRYRFLSVNQSFLDITGLTREQVIGKYVHEVIPEPSLTLVLEKYNQAIRDNTTVTWEEITQYPAGEKWGDVRVTPLTDATGRCTNLIGSVHDITERKLAEDKLRESEERYRSVIENAAEGITVAQDGMLQFANAQLLDMIQAGPEEIGGCLFTEFIHPDDRALVFDRFQRRVAGENVPQHYDFRVVGTRGKITWVQLSAVRIEWNGRPATLNFLTDITERRQAEEKLRESRQILEGILNTIPVRVFWKDKELTYLGCNTPFAQDAGFGKPEDIIGKDDYAMGWRDQAELYRADDRAVIESGNAKLMIEEPQTTPAGDTIYILTSKMPLRDARGDAIGVLGTYLDITDRKKAEVMLRESEERLLMAQEIGHIGGWEYNLQTNEIWGSAEGARIYGLPPVSGDFPIDRIEACIPERERVHQALVDLIHEEKEYNLEFAINPADGSPQKVIMSIARLEKDAQGIPVKVVGVIQDITHRKQAEEAFRESEEKFREIFNSVNDAVEIHEIDEHGLPGRFIEINDVGCRMLQYSREELLPKSPLEFTTDYHNRPLREIGEELKTAGHATFETGHKRKDGTIVPVEINAHVTRLLGKEVVISVVRDITERKRVEAELSESETRFRTMVEQSPFSIQVMSPDGRTLQVNRAFEELWGLALSDLNGYNILKDDELVRLGLMPYIQAGFSGDVVSVPPAQYDVRHLFGKGGKKWVQSRIYPIRDAAGSIRNVVLMHEDISERSQAEEALRQSETRFRALIQNSSDIIRILDVKGRIVYQSASAERILGFPSGFMTGRDPLEYVHPDDRDRVKKDFSEVLDRTNPGTPTEFRVRKADGNYLWVDALGTNLLDVPGVNGIVITTRPIQQRKEAEQALRENQARLANAMDIAGLVNWEFDVASGMFTFDDRFYALYDTTTDREGGNLMSAETYMQEFVYPDDRPAVMASIRKILATTDPDYAGQIEHRITPRDGSVRTIIARFAPIRGPDGKVIRTFGANQDITNFKLMESEIRSLNTSLEQRVRDRTEALAKTNEALEVEIAQRLTAEKKLQVSYNEKVMLLKEIHHRVKNNLQIIASLLNLQSRYITDAKTLAAIRESQNRVKAMALVHEKLYRSEDISHISLHDYIRFLCTGLFQSYDARSQGIQFTMDIHDINVDIDTAIPLGLILNELISNSLKYAFPEGRKGAIEISVKKEDHILTLLFHDTGIGIPAELNWRDTQSLGLRLVTTLVDQMNGTIELDCSSGTQFTMVLHEKEQKGSS